MSLIVTSGKLVSLARSISTLHVSVSNVKSNKNKPLARRSSLAGPRSGFFYYSLDPGPGGGGASVHTYYTLHIPTILPPTIYHQSVSYYHTISATLAI